MTTERQTKSQPDRKRRPPVPAVDSMLGYAMRSARETLGVTQFEMALALRTSDGKPHPMIALPHGNFEATRPR